MSARFLGSVILFFVGCSSAPVAPSLTDQQIDAVVKAWLTCDECWNRQIQHVVELGDQALRVLQGYFNGSRELESVAALTTRYEQDFADLEARLNSRTISVPETEGEYVQRHIDQHQSRVQLRAAAAIALIDVSALPNDWRRVRRVYGVVDLR